MLVLNGASALSSFSTSSTLGDRVGGRGQGVADGAGVGLGLGLELRPLPLGQQRPRTGRTRRSSRPGLSVAVIFQYSSETNARISFSRSAISRTATDWTRPALRCRATFFQSKRAELVADEPVEEPPRLLGVDLVHVDRADVAERLLDGPLGDLVEHDAADPLVGQVEHLLEVPGDRLALAVGVGRQVDDVGLGGLALQLGDRVLLARHDLVGRRVAVHRRRGPSLRFGQVADVPHARLDDVARAEELVDRLGLLGALDDHQRLRRPAGLPRPRRPASRRRPWPCWRPWLGAVARLAVLVSGDVSAFAGRRLGGLASHGVFLSCSIRARLGCRRGSSAAAPAGGPESPVCDCPGDESWYTTVWAGLSRAAPFK